MTPQQPMTLAGFKHKFATEAGYTSWRAYANDYPTLREEDHDKITELYANSVKAQADEEIEILQKMSVNQEYETQGYKKSLEEAIHWLKEANQFLTGDMSDCGLQVTMFIEKAENDHQLNPYKQ